MSPLWIAGLDASEDTEWIDTEQRGLVLRVRAGQMVWFVRYLFEGRARRYRIGDHPEIGLSGARKLAAVVRGRAAGGEDPQAERRARRDAVRLRRLGETVDAAVCTWLKDRKQGPLGRWRDGLDGGSARASLPHIRRLRRTLGKKLLSEVTPKDMERFILTPNAPATRNRGLCALRGFFGWAIRMGLIEKDPTAGIAKEHEVARMRVLSDDEIRAFIRGFDDSRYGRALRLLFLTGLRRDEVLSLEWRWIDMARGVVTLPPEAEKMGRIRDELRRVALSPQAVDLLKEQRQALFAEGIRSEFVFATITGERPHPDSLKQVLYRLRGRRSNGLPPSKDKRAKRRVAVIPDDVRIHDIRRTVADALLNRIGAPPWVVDHAVLGHARPKLLRTYMPTLPLNDAREALTKWAEELALILASGRTGTSAETLPDSSVAG